MSKSDTTKKIEKYLLTMYSPNTLGNQRINKMRMSFTANEVPVACGTTTSGLVDCVRIDETLINERKNYFCAKVKSGYPFFEGNFKCPLGEDKIELNCKNLACIANLKQTICDNSVCITAIEIKISKADFLSKNGHNFCGNCNYYAVPYYLYDEIKDLVPEDIGILIFYDGTQNENKKKKDDVYVSNYYGIKKKKECIYKELTDEDQKWLILSVMKRLQKMKNEDKDKLKKKIKEFQNCDDCGRLL